MKGRYILILIKRIFCFNFFSNNNFTNTKRTFIYGPTAWPVQVSYIMNILNECAIDDDIIIMQYSVCMTLYRLYEGYSKSSKTNSKKYFIYEIYKIIFLHSFHPIHNTSVCDVSIKKFRP